MSGSKTRELLLLFVFSRLCSFSSLLISDVDVEGKFLKLLRTDSGLLLHKSALFCFGIPCFVCFVMFCIDCTELLVLLVYVLLSILHFNQDLELGSLEYIHWND